METGKNLWRRYRPAAWRVQRQWVGLFLLGIVSILMVASLYLSVTTRAAIAGREIQLLQEQVEENARLNADYEMQLAALTTAETMRARARALGFEPADYEELLFVSVDAYVPRQAVDLSRQEETVAIPPLRAEYTQSLFEWFAERIQSSAGR